MDMGDNGLVLTQATAELLADAFRDQHQKSQVESDLFLSLKLHIDSQCKLNQLYQSRIRSFERFRKYCQQLSCCSNSSSESIKFDPEQFQIQYNKFDRNYRYCRKKIRKLRKQTKSSLSTTRYQNPYDTLYELFSKIDILERKIDRLRQEESHNQQHHQQELIEDDDDQYLPYEQICPEISITVIEPPESANVNGFIDNLPGNTVNGYFNGKPKAKTKSKTKNHPIISNLLQSKPQCSNMGQTGMPTTSFKQPTLNHSNQIPTFYQNTRIVPNAKATDSNNGSASVNPSPKMAKTETAKNPEKSKLMVCEIEGCKYSTTNTWSMKVHAKVTHSTERPFKCDKCPAAFKVKEALKTHQNTHEKKRFGCPFEGCPISYAYKKDIKKHVKIFHLKDAPLLSCTFEGCRYTTYNKEYLQKHKIVHTDLHRFRCDFEGCGYSTNRSDHLKSHRAVHSSQRQFKCGIEGCEYTTYRSDHLKSHRSVHFGERTFKCLDCGQVYPTKADLCRHQRLTHPKLDNLVICIRPESSMQYFSENLQTKQIDTNFKIKTEPNSSSVYQSIKTEH